MPISRLAETPEFELSDTDRLGLFVVSRLAQRQNVRVSLQPSPYGGTTAVVFIPDALLTDDVPDTNGIGFRLDRPTPSKEAELEESRRAALAQVPVRVPGLPASLLDGPVELEAPVDLDALGDFPDPLDDEDGDRGGLFHPRRALSPTETETTGPLGEQQHPVSGFPGGADQAGPGADVSAPVPLPRRGAPKLVSSHGRPVTEQRSRREKADPEPSQGPSRPQPNGLAPLPTRRRGTGPRGEAAGGPDRTEDRGGIPSSAGRERGEQPEPPALPRRTHRPAIASSGTDDTAASPTDPRPSTGSGTGPLPRRVRQANLAPQLKQNPARRTEDKSEPVERDADEVRSRMASLQRGWQRGRQENATDDDAHSGTAPPRTTKGDGR